MSLPVVVITGTSSGIGLQLALNLCAKPYQVIATLRKPEAAPALLKASKCDIQQLDVTCDTSAEALATYIKERYNRCDVLINNAGYGIPGNLEYVTIEASKQVFEVNVWGVMRMIQQLVPIMRVNGGGLVLTVSSTSGLRGLPCTDVYAGSKMAIEGMLESYRYTVRKDNVKVVLANPGPVDTPFADRLRKENGDERNGEMREVVERYVETMSKNNRSGQTAESCARAIAKIMEREYARDLRDGEKGGVFWNATSEFGQSVMDDILRHPEGRGGLYDAMWEDMSEVELSLGLK